MSEEVHHEVSGPPMLAMTSALRPPPARISKIGENLTLPFSVQINQLVAVSAGAFAGLVFVTMFILPFAGGSIVLFGSGLGIGGFLGMAAVTWSPLKGESLKTWLGLSVGSSRREKVEINGVEARAYIGIMPLQYSAAGEVKIVSRAVDVPAGSVDDRGVFIPLYQARPVVAQGSLRLPGPEDGFDAPKLRAEDTGAEPEAARRPHVPARRVTPRAQRGGEQLPPQPPFGDLPPPAGPRR